MYKNALTAQRLQIDRQFSFLVYHARLEAIFPEAVGQFASCLS